MLNSPFTPVTNCPLNSTVVTQTITIAAADNGKILTLDLSGSAVVNGAVVSTPVTLHTGDTLAIQTTSSSVNNTATFISVVFGSSDYFVTFTTIAPPSAQFDPAMYAVPFYQRTAKNRTVYNSTAHTYSVSNNGSIREFQTTASPSGLSNTTYQVMLLDPYNKSSHLIGTDGVIVATYATPDNCWAGASVYNIGKYTLWFGMLNKGEVGITSDGVNYSYLPVDSAPIAFATNIQGQNIWVACYGGTLYCYQPTGPLTFRLASQIQLTSNPTSLAMDNNGNVYVASMNSNTVVQYTPNGTLLGSLTVGNMPTGIAFASGTVFVSCAEDQTIIAINPSGMTLIDTIVLPEFPGLISVDPTNQNLCVACLSSANVYRYSATTYALVDVTTFGKNVLTAYSFGTTIIADHLQYDARPYIISINSLVPGLGFFENDQEPIQTLVQSTTVTATTLQATVPVAIPPGLGATIVKNGVNVGTSSTVANNDQFYIQFTTPSTGSTYTQIPCAVGNYVEMFNSTTAVFLSQPSAFYWSPVTAQPNTLVSSPIETIANLTPGTLVSVSTNNGTLLKNGIQQVGTFAVQNGDTIQLQVTSADTGLVSAFINVGSMELLWVVQTTSIQTPTTISYIQQSVTGKALNTSVVSNAYLYTGVPTTIEFPANLVVLVNGSRAVSGATINTNTSITIVGVSSALPNNTVTYNVFALTGVSFEFSIATVQNVIPYPADFGVIYYAAPSIDYVSSDITISALTAPASIEFLAAESILISDVDTTLNTVTNINNGTVVGLNVRGQINVTNAMYTIPVYALALDGVTWVEFGSVRVVPTAIAGASDYPVKPQEVQNGSQFIQYNPEQPETLSPLSGLMGWGTKLNVPLPISEIGSHSSPETGIAYTTLPAWTGIVDTGLSYITQQMGQYGNHPSIYQNLGANRGAPGEYIASNQLVPAPIQNDQRPLVNMGSYNISTYSDGYESTRSVINASSPTVGNGTALVSVTLQMAYADIHALFGTKIMSSSYNYKADCKTTAKMASYNYKADWKTAAKMASYNYKADWKTTAKMVSYNYKADWRTNPSGLINHMVGKWSIPANMILRGVWVTNAPIPELIESSKVLALMPQQSKMGWGTRTESTMPQQGEMGWGTRVEVKLLALQQGEMGWGTRTESVMPQPDDIGWGTITEINPRQAQDVLASMNEIAGMAAGAEIVRGHEVDTGMSAISYEDEVYYSVHQPTLYGGFADEADAQVFVTANNLTNAHTVELSNGYWVIISDPTKGTISCSIPDQTGPGGNIILKPIAWLLGGG